MSNEEILILEKVFQFQSFGNVLERMAHRRLGGKAKLKIFIRRIAEKY